MQLIRPDIAEKIKTDRDIHGEHDSSVFEPVPLQLEIPIYQEPVEAVTDSQDDHSSSVIIIDLA